MIMNDISQPHARASNGMVAGAANAPTEAPLLNIEVEKARSFLGKYSAVTLMAAGKLPASPTANTNRKARNIHTLMVETASIASIVPSLTNKEVSHCIHDGIARKNSTNDTNHAGATPVTM